MPMEERVNFLVNVTAFERGDHWMVRTLETGIITYGTTRDEAETRNGEANQLMVASWKRRGRDLLERFMREHSIQYTVAGERRQLSSTGEQQLLAA